MQPLKGLLDNYTALQKACQSLEINRNGLGADGKELTNQDQILRSLEFPSWNRLFHIYDAIKLGIPFKKIQQKTRIDDWFLRQIKDLIDLDRLDLTQIFVLLTTLSSSLQLSYLKNF